MLSRIAESLFWIGRYLERADGTARILDVHLQLLLEDPWIDEDTACRSLLGVMGTAAPEQSRLSRADVLGVLGVNAANPASIAHSLVNARENARRAREIISTEFWECLNTTVARMPVRVSSERVHNYFQWVHERTNLAVGINNTIMSRDEAYHFFVLGRSLERADMTARLLATRSLGEVAGPSWTTILRSCGAYEAYLRTYRGVPSTRNAAEFLLLDRLFPRSVLFNLSRSANSLRELEPRASGRVGVTDSAQRLLGQAISDLEYRPITDSLDELPGNMEAIQRITSATSDSIKQRYFPTHAIPTWSGERL